MDGATKQGTETELSKGEHMKTIRELFDNPKIGEQDLIAALEARERERDERRDEERRAAEKEVAKLQADVKLHWQKAGGDYWVWQGDGSDHLESLCCPILIHPSDMRKRDEAEKERVKVAVSEISFTEVHRKTIIDAIYPPPAPTMLPAGMYEVTRKDGADVLMSFIEPFQPGLGCTYRRLKYADEPVS